MNKEFTLESFIDWCDDMYIVNEASIQDIGKGITKTIKKAIDWIIEHIKIIGRRIKDAIRVLMGKKTSSEEKMIKILEKQEKELKNLKNIHINTLEDLENALNKTERCIQMTKHDEDISNIQDISVKDLIKNINNLHDEINELKKSYTEEKKQSDEYKSHIRQLESKLKKIAENEEREIENRKKSAIAILNNKDNVIDKWGYIEATLKAYPQAEKQINNVYKLATMAITDSSNNNNTLSENLDFIEKVENDVQECYATCKSIFRHSEEESARQNPKSYSYDVVEDFYNGMKHSIDKLNKLSGELKTLNGYESYHYGSGSSSNTNVSRVMQIICKLISTIESYANLANKVYSSQPNVRPRNSISYRNGKGDYNYGSNKRRSIYSKDYEDD